ncbi:MAG: hypothetical protein JO163_18130 [Methylobacteriaceae bacterium]|nr:hypothetical protein [Methylobacteriaceae bacterium]MBV9704651.1 hypothetical protein [Methylobacteriaceae bacterium]
MQTGIRVLAVLVVAAILVDRFAYEGVYSARMVRSAQVIRVQVEAFISSNLRR